MSSASSAATSVDEMMARINQICTERGAPYSNYCCKEVGWEDAERGTTSGGSLTSLGRNITDTKLCARDGRALYTVRTSNFDEKIGRIGASDVYVGVGRNGRPMTLRDLLRNMGEHGGYAGVPKGTDLLHPDLDDEVGVRFQTTFLPVEGGSAEDKDTGGGCRQMAAADGGGRGALEFCSENYNYQTTSADDPRNLLILATSQGISVQQDGPGRQRIYHHQGRMRDPDESIAVGRHWLEAERTGHSVAGPQEESEEAAAQAERAAGEAEDAAREAAGRAKRLREEAKAKSSAFSDKDGKNGDSDWGQNAAETAVREAEEDAERSRAEATRASGEARRRRELREDALNTEDRGKAPPAAMGTAAMGERCSAVLIVQVPLEQVSLEQPPLEQIVSQTTDNKEAIGIDLGTTYSCVGVWQNERVEIIAGGPSGDRTTPSVISFSGSELLIESSIKSQVLFGDDAKSRAVTDPSNTVFGAKRLIGRNFFDPDVQFYAKHWPFKIVCGPGGDPLIEVKHCGETKSFTAWEISAMVLGKMRDIAEEYLGKEVKNAVITVPAHFNDSQRQATKDAGAICGLNVLRIINEPTAAAIAYNLDSVGVSDDEINVVIFDLGGGTFDLTLLTIDGIFEVKSKAGDTRLGGEDFDDRLVDYFLQEFRCRHGKDASLDQRSIYRLRMACERAKRTLSVSTVAYVEIDALYDGIDYASTITRARFENLCRDYFEKCVGQCETLLRDAELSKDDVHEVVLVGGSTRIPKIQEMVSDFFDGKELRMSINPDEAVAHGATHQAAILSGALKLPELPFLDVVPLSEGVAVRHDNALPPPAAAPSWSPSGALFRPVIDRNTTVPVKKELTFTTSEDNQSSVTIDILHGDHPLTKHNFFVARFELGPLPPMPRGTPQIRVVFYLDAEGNHTVSASCGALEKVVPYDACIGRITEDDIERMVEDSKLFRARDGDVVDALEEQARMECLVSSMRSALEMPAVQRSLGGERCISVGSLLDNAETLLSVKVGASDEGAIAEGDTAVALREHRALLESSLCDVQVAAEAGVSNAARVSRGSQFDTWNGLTVREPRRAAEHCTVTVTMYNTVCGGVPSPADVCDAIDDLERLYDACDWCGRLSDNNNGAGLGQAKRVQVRRALMALSMARHPRIGANSPARDLPQDLLLLHVGSFLVPELGKLQELTPETVKAIRGTILGTLEYTSGSQQEMLPDPSVYDMEDID